MANDAMDQLMKSILKAEKAYGDDHKYRHVFGALREARYAASKLSANANYESPGAASARDAAGKAHVPPAEDERNPNVPDTPNEGGDNGNGDGAT
jgi:hypothetical protein